MNDNNRAASNEAAALDRPQPLPRSAYRRFASVRYEIGIFAAGAAETAARGHFIHVYVDRASERPVALPDRLSQVVKELA